MSTREELLAAIRHREANPLTREQVLKRVEEWLSRELTPQDWKSNAQLRVQSTSWKWLGDHAAVFVRTDKGAQVPLVEAAETNPAAWDDACRRAAASVEVGEPVPLYLREFIGAVLRGAVQRPTGGARKSFWKDYQICLAVAALEERAGINPTKSEATGKDVFTGCGFVSERLGMSVHTVASIWGRRERFSLNTELLFSVMTMDRF